MMMLNGGKRKNRKKQHILVNAVQIQIEFCF